MGEPCLLFLHHWGLPRAYCAWEGNQSSFSHDGRAGGSGCRAWRLGPGKTGTGGENEKILNLAVTEKLTEYLEQGGAEVILTRNADTALGGSKHADMAERQRIANETGADILVSIHQNAFPSAKAKGAQVFYHKSSERGKILAECVQESLKSRVDGSNRRMAKENKEYYILRTTQIPAVIVECGFLSNAEEERLLNDTAYQERLAWAVYCGILDYFEKISII